MYICICSAVTDRQIRAAVAAGATTLAEVSMPLGVAAGCGCCREAAQKVLRLNCGGDCATCSRHEAAAA